MKEGSRYADPVTAADTPDFTAACAHEHIFGSRALTALRAYGLGDPSVQFYLCRKGVSPLRRCIWRTAC